MMGMAKKKTCGECIHAEICKKVNGSWYHPENIAYCNAFKDRKNCVEVVRCKDCKHYNIYLLECHNGRMNGVIGINGFCFYGERREGE